ncbi:MAG: DNA gyrase inhibitor YacG [Planctomycetota bacterium]|jgi:endogenous inhibitor of DNA gyrase (YacG/DUF329 family)
MPVFECPICDKSIDVPKASDHPWRPFCSERCKMIDLGRWLDGSYVTSQTISPEDRDDEEAADRDDGGNPHH